MSRSTHITKFCHMFLDGADQYVFIKNLGHGGSSQAQLVLHLQSGELRVRKVSHRRLDDEAKQIEDREKVLFYLQNLAAKRKVQPHISRLYSATDVPAVQTGEDGALWSRVCFLKYYNGGTIGDLYATYHSMGQSIPSTTIWRLMSQLVDALDFMSTCGDGVLHGDIHSENIFLHYDGAPGGVPHLKFYLGDFGNSERGALTDPNKTYRDDVSCLSWYLKRWLFVSSTPKTSERDELWKYLYRVVLPVLDGLTAVDRLPDLKPLVTVLRNAPAGPPESLPEWMDPRAEDARLPPFYTYQDECFDRVGVDGPWHLAKVSINTRTKAFKVLSVSPEAYNTAVSREPCSSSPSTPSWAK